MVHHVYGPRRATVFDTLKNLFFSLWGVWLVCAVALGSLWCLFAYQALGLLYPLSIVTTLIVYALWDDHKRSLAAASQPLTGERIQKARAEYLEIPSVKATLEERQKTNKHSPSET